MKNRLFRIIIVASTCLGLTAGGNVWAAPASDGKTISEPASIGHRTIPQNLKETPSSRAQFDGAWPIPGIDGWLKIGGYAKGDYIQDFDPIGNEQSFDMSTIPVPKTHEGGQASLNGRQSRFNIDSRFGTNVGTVRAFIEMDFYGSGNTLRLRHAYAQNGAFLAGQTWTNFMDTKAQPSTLDFEGPESMLQIRQSQIRYTPYSKTNFQWSLSIEDPSPQISSTGSVDAVSRSQVPDIPAYVMITPSWGHIRLNGILRQLRYVNTSGSIDETETGWGVNLSGTSKIGSRDHMFAQFVMGKGISRYIQSFSGSGSDAFYTPENGLVALEAKAGLIGYKHFWSNTWNSTLSAGSSEIVGSTGQSGDAIKRMHHSHFNLIWEPNKHFNVGGEIMWGEVENQDGQKGNATRVMISVFSRL